MSQGKILVIDDEQVICEMLKEILVEKGFEVNFSLSGHEGISEAKTHNYDVVITDLKMPDINGITVLEEIKKFDLDTVLIVMTGYPSFETVQSALRIGAFNYLAKPFNIEEIEFVIKRAVAYRRLAAINKRLIQEIDDQNVKLEEAIKERTRELMLIYDIAQDITSTLKLDETLDIIVDRISKVLAIEICSILLFDEKNGVLVIRAARGLEDAVIKNTKLKPGERISGWVFLNKAPVFVTNIEQDSRFRVRSKEKYYTNSFISIPLITKEKAIGVLNVNNKHDRTVFTENDFRIVRWISKEAAIAIENAQLYTSLEDTYFRTIKALVSAIQAKDHYTATHSEHVSKYAAAIARTMGLSTRELQVIEEACQLHDLGKIGIQDHILTKQGALTTQEWEEIKQHPTKSVEILKPLTFLKDVILLVEQHHERFDGKGYPAGIKGEKILLGARIIALSDAYDAMTTDRPYRKAFSKSQAVEEIKNGSGSQFDPKVVQAFLQVVDTF